MIVPSMSNLEIWKAISSDREKINIKIDSLLPKIVKAMKKERKFPAFKWEEYEHQGSKNKYLIGFGALSAEQADRPSTKVLTFLHEENQKMVVAWGYWPYRKFGSQDRYYVPYIGYYSGHFFSRYRERIWNDSVMSYNELLCRYFFRNQVTVPIELNKDIQKKYQEYGEFSEYAFQVHDGTCFLKQWSEGDELNIGKEDSDRIAVAVYYTFVNNTMMTETQNKAIIKEGTKYMSNYYRNLLNDAMTETFIRQQSINSEKYIK